MFAGPLVHCRRTPGDHFRDLGSDAKVIKLLCVHLLAHPIVTLLLQEEFWLAGHPPCCA